MLIINFAPKARKSVDGFVICIPVMKSTNLLLVMFSLESDSDTTLELQTATFSAPAKEVVELEEMSSLAEGSISSFDIPSLSESSSNCFAVASDNSGSH